jgi:hypothetical protein
MKFVRLENFFTIARNISKYNYTQKQNNKVSSSIPAKYRNQILHTEHFQTLIPFTSYLLTKTTQASTQQPIFGSVH